jgi:hypothetical protein
MAASRVRPVLEAGSGSRIREYKRACPLYARKRTCAVQLRMSALGLADIGGVRTPEVRLIGDNGAEIRAGSVTQQPKPKPVRRDTRLRGHQR